MLHQNLHLYSNKEVVKQPGSIGDTKEATKESPDPSLTPRLTGEGDEEKEKEKNVAGASKQGDVTEGEEEKEKEKNVAGAGKGGDVTEGEEKKEKEKNVAAAGKEGDVTDEDNVKEKNVPHKGGDVTTEGDEEKEKEKNVPGAGKGGSAESAIDVNVEEIESMVDKIVILEADVLKYVYGFEGVSESTSFEGDAHYQCQGILKRWKEVPKQGYAEINLLRLKTCCKDLRFSPILETTVDGNFRWHYAMIVIDPTATALKAKRSQHQREPVTSYTGFLQAFYEKGFLLSNDISSRCMASALLMETSTIIVTKKVETATKKGTDAAVTNTFLDAKLPKILVAVTFRP